MSPCGVRRAACGLLCGGTGGVGGVAASVALCDQSKGFRGFLGVLLSLWGLMFMQKILLMSLPASPFQDTSHDSGIIAIRRPSAV